MNLFEEFKKEISQLRLGPEQKEIGEVAEIRDGVAMISGLRDVENFELIEIEAEKEAGTVLGLALNLEEENVGAVILGKWQGIKEGNLVRRTEKILSVPVGKGLVGRIINPLGVPLDNKGEINSRESSAAERKGPAVIERAPVNSPLHSGIKIIDALIPIGRGQRELILGDRGTGKTALALDIILNQKKEEKRPLCVYVAIGQRKAKIKRLIEILEKEKAMDYTVLVCAFPDDPASFLYLAPYSGMAIAEYFRDRGEDALVVFDDLTKHAWAWREISLILKRPPGREAYPGDIFYLHSRLLERAAKLSQDKGGGSLTALPIIETQTGDISAYIPTNVISICDGQIVLDSALFNKGQKPAVDIGKSVSRVGSRAQLAGMRKVAGTMRLDLAQFQELERFSEFTEELDPQTKRIIEKGKRVRELLKQADLNPLPFEEEVVLLFAAAKGGIEDIGLDAVRAFGQRLIEEVKMAKPEILPGIRKKGDFDEETENNLQLTVEKVKKEYANPGN